jgi:NAD binding domain of 6-phosphogluconate dehydrogenase
MRQLHHRSIRRRTMLSSRSNPLTSSAAVERASHSASNGRRPDDIGFVGLGRMGAAMATNLAAAGHRVIAYVRRAKQMDGLTALGLKPTTDVTSLFNCKVVISMLPDGGLAMSTLGSALRELLGLFVDNGALAVGILAVMVLAGMSAILLPSVPLAAGSILLLGLPRRALSERGKCCTAALRALP